MMMLMMFPGMLFCHAQILTLLPCFFFYLSEDILFLTKDTRSSAARPWWQPQCGRSIARTD
jgi:hypothetical protein